MEKNLPIGLLIFSLSLLGIMSACRKTVPKDFRPEAQQPDLYPAYHEAVILPNIAPLNFRIDEVADQYRTRIYAAKGEEIILSGKVVQIPPPVNGVKYWQRIKAILSIPRSI